MTEFYLFYWLKECFCRPNKLRDYYVDNKKHLKVMSYITSWIAEVLIKI